MNRSGLVLAFAVATVVGLIFAAWPELDLEISRLFLDPGTKEFKLSHDPRLGHLRDIAMWIVGALAAPAVITLIAKLLLPQRRLAMSGRAAVFLLTTLALAPGLMANVILKDHYGRPRPIDVRDLGGTEPFLPWWDPRGDCRKNCSFVAGEGSGAFWTLAPAALAPPPLRPFAYAAALGFGSAVGLLRIAFGGHFFTDVVFAGVFTFLIIWCVHGLLYRWSASRTTDAAIERALERLTVPAQAVAQAARGLVARVRRSDQRPSGGTG